MKKQYLFFFIIFIFCYKINAQKILPTKLTITVVDRLGNLVEGAEVSLYLSQIDYQNSANIQNKGLTNKKGVVKFTDLQAFPYYIECKKNEMNNNGEGVMTDTLQSGKINKVFVVIE